MSSSIPDFTVNSANNYEISVLQWISQVAHRRVTKSNSPLKARYSMSHRLIPCQLLSSTEFDIFG